MTDAITAMQNRIDQHSELKAKANKLQRLCDSQGSLSIRYNAANLVEISIDLGSTRQLNEAATLAAKTKAKELLDDLYKQIIEIERSFEQ